MKKIFFVCCYLLYSSLLAQNITFVYELRYKLNLSKADYKNELFYLDTSNKESLFRSEHDKYSDSLIERTGYGLGHKLLYNHQYYTHKNLSEKKISKIIITPFFGDIYSLTIEDLVWKISNDKLKISNFNCQKAELIYGGRRWIAWFTQEIPLQDGPYIFNGLPGLIVKISDDKSDYNFELVKIRKNLNKIPYRKPKKEITWDVLNKLEKDFYFDPYSEVKARNIPYKTVDQNENTISISMKHMTENLQKNIRDTYNPIELDKAIKYEK